MFFIFIFFFSAPAFCWDFPIAIGPKAQDIPLLRFTEQAEPKPMGNVSATPVGIEEHNFTFSVPVAKNESDTWTLSGKSAWMDIHSKATLPSGVVVPTTLWDSRAGVGYTHRLEKERSWGLTSSFGSASDRPFSSGNVDTVNVSATYSFAESMQSHWLLLLNYSNNRGFLNNIPLPGFAYIYTPSKSFTGVFGIPFAMLSWRPEASDWALSGTIFFPRFGKVELDYIAFKPLTLFFMLESLEQSFLRANRSDPDNRLVYLENRSMLGVKSPISKTLFAELSGGYAFARSFYEAEKFSDRNTNSVSIANGAIYMANITMLF